MLCGFLLYNKANPSSCIYTYPHPFSLLPPSPLPPSHSRSSQSPELRSVFYKGSKKGQSQRTSP